MNEPNPATGNLPAKAARMLADVYDERRKAGLSKARASEVAWGVVKKYYHRKRGETRWRRREKPTTGSARRKAKTRTPAKPRRRNASPKRSTQRLPTTTLKNAPARLDDSDLAELGSVLELETDHASIAWPRGKAVLAWSPKAKSLVIVEGGKRSTTNTAKRTRARGAFERWAARDASKTATVDVNPRGAWKRVGNVRRIDYHSNKWGRRAEYTHKSGPGVRLYMKGSWDNPPRLWVLKGGRMTVTRRGIVN